MNPPTPTPRTDAAIYPMDTVDIVWPEFARTLEREITLLRAEVELDEDLQLATESSLKTAIDRAEKAEAAFADPQRLHAHCLRTLTDGQIAHLFGERMTEVANRADRAEAALSSPPLLTGKLTHAGTCYIGEEHTDGVFIAIDREQLKALPRLPMYEQIELRAMKGTPSTL
jgi:hypothetical protein